VRIAVSKRTDQSFRTPGSLGTGGRNHWTLRGNEQTIRIRRFMASSHLRCFGSMTNFPIASASADVVQRTSLVDMFKKICLFARETQLVNRATATYLLFGYISNLNVVLNSKKASGEATSTPLIYERL
jgi:hypothetical protein